MTVTTDDLRAATGAGPNGSTDDLDSCLTVGVALLEQYADEAWVDIPSAVRDRAHLAVAVELFNQSKAPNGILTQQFADGTPVRIGADPLRPAYPLLRRYVGTGIA